MASSSEGKAIRRRTNEELRREQVRLWRCEPLVDFPVNRGKSTVGFWKERGSGSMMF